jgi:hypothetical protein|tara:strand:+ start:16291 stop:17196 length:906 start_codon:yes stop_codon:yes gene_type:complete
MKHLAPIAFICYNRYDHLTKSLKSLKRNKLAKNSKIYIFSDGPKNSDDIKKINKIRSYLKKLKGFKSKTYFFRKKNMGNKLNIVSSVNEVLKKNSKIIVVEDDLVVSGSFLFFMNNCLNYYSDQKKIWHINGWSYPFLRNNKDDIIFLKSMNCWGWATWKNRWNKISLNEEKYISIFSKKMIHNFDIESSTNNWSQMIRNKKKLLNTWAVFWHATIFSHNGITIYPKFSLVKNIGTDGSSRMAKTDEFKTTFKDNFTQFKLNNNIDVKRKFRESEFNHFLKKNKFRRKIFVYLKKFWFNSY